MIIGPTEISREGDALVWTAGLQIDADGAPDAYHPNSARGRDNLRNAGTPGAWYGLVTVGGIPVVQGEGDPCPGFYVSPTALVDRARRQTDPRRYVDSNTIPYLSMPPDLRVLGVNLGDVAAVSYRGQWSPAIFADVGPRRKIGEGSVALARALGIPESPRHGGVGAGVRVCAWPGSAHSPPWPRLFEEIAAQVTALLAGLDPLAT